MPRLVTKHLHSRSRLAYDAPLLYFVIRPCALESRPELPFNATVLHCVIPNEKTPNFSFGLEISDIQNHVFPFQSPDIESMTFRLA
jgi:hypothetical protein